MKIRTRLGNAACILALVVPGAHAQSAHELFQQALVSERSRADLDHAVQLYQRIADEHAGDHQLAARALLRLGGIREARGGAGAIASYERLVREHAGVEPEASRARSRLSALRSSAAAEPGTPPTRRLILDYGEDVELAEYRVTHDGSHLLGYNEVRRGFELVDIDSRQIRVLTSEGPDPELEYVDRGLLSADGDEITATVLQPHDPEGQPRRMELRVFRVGEAGPGRLLRTWERSPYIFLRPIGWFADEARIWLWGMRTDRAAEIAWVDASTGAFGVLRTLAWRDLTQPPSVSPDGRFIAFHEADTRESPADVFVIATDGSRESRIENPATDSRPMFAPDGSGIVFVSDRREGIQDLWFQPLSDGRPTGAPRVVFRDVAPLGTARRFAENGSLAYYFASTHWEIFTAELDLAAGLVGPPERIEPRANEMSEAVAFSPDGRHMAHTRDRGRRLVLRDVESGSEREYPLGRRLMGPNLDWCRDDDVVFLSGYQEVAVGLRVDLESGGAERLPLGNPGRVLCVGNGQDIVYVAEPGVVDGPSRIIRRALATGVERTLHQGRLERYLQARSPDGTQIAFVELGADQADLVVLPTDGGEPRVVAASSLIRGFGRLWSQFTGLAWLPDGDALLVVRSTGQPSTDETAPEVTVSRLALDTGVETEVDRMRLPAYEGGFYGAGGFAVSPDGSRIAFNRHAGTVAQVWSIDGLLPYIQSGESAPAGPSIR